MQTIVSKQFSPQFSHALRLIKHRRKKNGSNAIRQSHDSSSKKSHSRIAQYNRQIILCGFVKIINKKTENQITQCNKRILKRSSAYSVIWNRSRFDTFQSATAYYGCSVDYSFSSTLAAVRNRVNCLLHRRYIVFFVFESFIRCMYATELFEPTR